MKANNRTILGIIQNQSEIKKNAQMLRKALKTGNLSQIEQAAPEPFTFFGRKGPFAGFDFLPDEQFEELERKYPDEVLNENDPTDQKIRTLRNKIRNTIDHNNEKAIN